MSTYVLPFRNKQFINNEDIINCPICNTKLRIKYKLENTVDECYECRYDDRPFGMCRKNRGECTCKWYQIENKYIICNKCCKCKNCNEKIEDYYLKSTDNDICKKCVDLEREKEKELQIKKEQYKFSNKWKSSTASDKLSFYGTKKLMKLARKKELKGRSKMNKEELILSLKPLVDDLDFPIK